MCYVRHGLALLGGTPRDHPGSLAHARPLFDHAAALVGGCEVHAEAVFPAPGASLSPRAVCSVLHLPLQTCPVFWLAVLITF